MQKQQLTSVDWLGINSFAIYNSVKAKNPINNTTLVFEDFKKQFEQYALDNYLNVSKLIKGNKKNKVRFLPKLKAPIWRPNAIYGNRHNGCSQDRVIMGSGLYAFDIDFDYYNWEEHQKKLDGYKETLKRDCPNIFAVYKSFSMSGLHIITKGISVKDNKSYRQMWEYERRKLKRDFRFVKIDEKAKDITRALFIGSDDNPLIDINYNFINHVHDEDGTVRKYVEEKLIELPSDVDIEFAKIQCMIKLSFIETKDRFIRFFTNYQDLDDVYQKGFQRLSKT